MQIIPPQLNENDSVWVVAPSFSPDKDALKAGIKILTSWGLHVKIGKYVNATLGAFAGSDEQRRHDLQLALDDEECRAIFLARGGYGLSRIIDTLDFSSFVKFPKWICGYSDATVLHLAINRLGIASIHSEMVAFYTKKGSSSAMESLHRLLFQNASQVQINSNSKNIPGIAEGTIIGGNLSVLCASIGTSTDVSFEGKILFIEEVGEKVYRIDRMLNQLERSGKMNGAIAIIFGHFTDISGGDTAFGFELDDVLLNWARRYQVPTVFGCNAGHQSPNLAIPFGKNIVLKVEENEVQLV